MLNTNNNCQKMRSYLTCSSVFFGLIFSGNCLTQDAAAKELAQEKAIVAETHASLSASQQTVEQLDNATRKLLQEYQNIMQRNDYQQYYQFQLEQLAKEQQTEIANLEQQLEELAYLELTLMPLMQSILVALEEFVAVDLPFKQQERLAGVQQLRQRVNSSSLSLPEKYRLLMEVWQIEYDYGRSIETWRGTINQIDGERAKGESLAVNFFRLGRVALYYQTPDGAHSAIWDQETKSWQPLAVTFNRQIQQAIQVAAERVAPDLLALPLPTPGAKAGSAQ
ncbi:DUF3450 domain-containing protein [Planctobacterium marinum]|uniref:DUF3450 domain-containing protein n=1 Tax=Planctobacterium marinum TaxID=1631968 RepID=A0AA48KSD4_9ALTE|nr:DUF3450 domain-containing protein [Planctobacterium marinum]